MPVLPNKIKLQGLPVSERVNFGFEDLFSEKNKWVSNTPSSSRRYASDSSPTAPFANGYTSLMINSS